MSTTLLAARRSWAPVAAEDKVAVASQLQLTWWRFRRHRLAVWSGVIVALFYLVAVFADFLATIDPHDTDAKRSYIPPQAIHWFDDGRFAPARLCAQGRARPAHLQARLHAGPEREALPAACSRAAIGYNLLGLFPTDRHLLGVTNGRPQDGLFLLGTDLLGRDVWSRLLLASRTSLTIGLVGVALSLFLGVLLGGISGLYGGWIDIVIQRVIEILRSIPTIPLWMGLAAALPSTWSVTQVYLAITVIISLIGWTELARVVRGRFLAMREEDFITAAELAGASRMRIIFRHMVPSFLSHIIAAVSLALPAMIISETTLSFLGLGLRPPAISWGVLLQDAQNLQALAVAPWLLVDGGPGHHRHPRLQLPGRRAPRRGRPLWLSRSSRSATSRPTSSRTRAWCGRSTAPASRCSPAGRWASSANRAAARASPRARSCASSSARAASRAARSGSVVPMASASTSPARPAGPAMREIRGGEIGLVFQEPMTSFSAYHTVGNQLIEAIRLHSDLSKAAARERAIELLRMVGMPQPRAPHRRVCVRAVGRPAPAGDDRHGARRPSRAS